MREARPSGVQVQDADQNVLQQYRGGHDCEGPRCVCQRYENGELAVVVMSQNRNASNQERDEGYQNSARGYRSGFQNYPSGSGQNNHPNLNPNYQNPVDLIRSYNRDRQLQEPEENIYERLDNDEDIVDNEQNVTSNSRSDQNSPDHHTYERIDNRPWYRGGTNYRGNGSYLSNFPGSSTLNDMDPRHLGQYDASRNVYLDSSRGLSNQSCLSRLGRLGRNCFSTDNIACASNRRYMYQMGQNCVCQFCRYLDARYICHYCHNSHDRLYYYDAGNVGTLGSSRHYIYQVTRSCRCTFCRGEFPYARFPISSTRLSDTFRRDCHCRNPSSCICNRSRFLSYSNPAIYIGRIDRPAVGQSVNNLLYGNPAIYVGRLERSCVTGLSNLASGTNLSGSTDPTASTSNPASSAGTSDHGSSASRPSFNISANPSTSNASVCPMNRVTDRRHTCDDSCIRNQSGHAGSIYQLLGRCEKTDCQHGRVSVHWLFVNKWLSSRGPSGSERNPDMTPKEDEHLEQPESDSDEC